MNEFMNKLKEVHIVIATEGDHSDKTEWVAGVYANLTLAKAEMFIHELADTEKRLIMGAWLDRYNCIYSRIKMARIASEVPLEGPDWPSSVTEARIRCERAMHSTGLSEDEQKELKAEAGPRPDAPDGANYRIISVPFNLWGAYDSERP